MTNRDEQMLMDRISGSTLRDVGERRAMTAEGARLAIAREGRKQIDRLELALLANRKTGDVELFVIPDHAGPDFDLALAYLRWATGELTKRGIKVQVHYRPTYNGVVIGLEDVTDYRKDTRG